jgi:hypothetical protein
MRRLEDNPHVFVYQGLNRESFAVTEWRPNEGDVDRAALQPGDQVWRVALLG